MEPTSFRTRLPAPNWCCVTVMCRSLTGDGDSAARYDQAAARRMQAMESLLWDDQKGAWFDYSLATRSRHLEFYPSNLAPLWARCYSGPELADEAVRYLKVGVSREPR